MADPTWTFPARFRARAFGWKGTAPASQRMKDALAKIKAVQRKDPVLDADGAVRLIGRIVPAIEETDGSSGAIGTAVARAVNALAEIIVAALASAKVGAAWLDRLWEVYLKPALAHGFVEMTIADPRQVPDQQAALPAHGGWGSVVGGEACMTSGSGMAGYDHAAMAVAPDPLGAMCARAGLDRSQNAVVGADRGRAARRLLPTDGCSPDIDGSRVNTALKPPERACRARMVTR